MYHLNKIMIFITLILFMFIGEVNAIVKPTQEFYVNDYANILSDETEKYIIEKSAALSKIDGTQIVVVTVENLEGITIEQYAIKLARDFGIGSSEKDNGLLLLLALEEREFRVEVGYGLEGILNDAKTGNFQDEYIIPYLKEDKWDEGIINGYNAFYSEIVRKNNLDLEYTEPESGIEIRPLSVIIVIIGLIAGLLIQKNAVKIHLAYIILWLMSWIFLHDYASPLMYNIEAYFIISAIRRGDFTVGGTSFGNKQSKYNKRNNSSNKRISYHGGGGSFGGGGSSRKF